MFPIQRENELRNKLAELRRENERLRGEIERFFQKLESECGSRDLNDPGVFTYLLGDLLLTISTINSKMTGEEASFICALILERSRRIRELVDLFAGLNENNKAIVELSNLLGAV